MSSKKGKNNREITEPSPKRSESPNIYRFIAESSLGIKSLLVLVVVSTSLLGITTLQTVSVYRNLSQEREQASKEFSYWRQITQKYPSRDAYIQRFSVAVVLGDREDASFCLNKIRTLDPDFMPISSLEAALEDISN